MFPGMMDPEMMRLAQEQMSRMSPEDLSRIQQQMMSNPELMKMASDSMKYMNPEDLRNAAEQLKSTQPNEMAEIGEKMANLTPEDLSSMRSRVDAQTNYQLSAAQMLKQKGNELHSQGKYNEALENYLRAKNNLKSVPASKGGSLLLACSLNLMSCYLKTKQFDECIKEGVEVLATDPKNVKALYRRGQAYKTVGQFEDAVSDLTKALEFSPDDNTIADVLRDAKEQLTENGGKNAQEGLRTEEITDEIPTSLSATNETLSSDSSAQKTKDDKDLQALKDDKKSIRPGRIGQVCGYFVKCIRGIGGTRLGIKLIIRSFQNFMSQSNPKTLASMGGERISPDMVKTASNAISSMPPEELERMLEMATSFQGNNNPNITPDMVKSASDMMNKMPPEELQNMLEMASSLNEKEPEGGLKSNGFEAPKIEENLRFNEEDIGESSTLSNSRNASAQPSFPSSSLNMQEQVRNQMKNPAMREMMSSMMKSMSPEMMTNLSEQFGYKLSQEDAVKAQQAMSNLTPESLDKMMKWADRTERAIEGARSTKNWLLGKQGLALALFVLVFAILLHWLGYIGH